jgi:hypothetical protein
MPSFNILKASSSVEVSPTKRIFTDDEELSEFLPQN